MRPSRIVLLLVAILAGGLAAFLATRGDAPAPQVVTETKVVEEQKTQILVAIGPIGVGQRLSPETVQWQAWPEGAVRPEYINVNATPDALDQLTGAVARFEIFPGEPIIEQKLVRAEQGYLSAVLDTGRRGVSIGVSAASASGGFIVPNDHVDVILTRSGATGLISQTILENVKVLAIGARLGETGTTGGPSNPDNPRAEVFADQTIATLDLDPVQAETVINASRVGTLSLALRSIVDFDEAPGEMTRRSSQQAVRIIRGGNESSVMAGSAAEAEVTAEVDPAAYVLPDGSIAPLPAGEVPPEFQGAAPPPVIQ
jgi:pilus assembly protein CpaB